MIFPLFPENRKSIPKLPSGKKPSQKHNPSDFKLYLS